MVRYQNQDLCFHAVGIADCTIIVDFFISLTIPQIFSDFSSDCFSDCSSGRSSGRSSDKRSISHTKWLMEI